MKEKEEKEERYFSEVNGRTRVSPSSNLFMSYEIGFYGHFLPSHFKKTKIIRTNGR